MKHTPAVKKPFSRKPIQKDLINVDSEKNILDAFNEEIGSSPEPITDLFTVENAKIKTDLTLDEVSIATILNAQADYFDMPLLKKVVDDFIELRISLDRKSRKEYVEGLGRLQERQEGFLDKIGNKLLNSKQ